MATALRLYQDAAIKKLRETIVTAVENVYESWQRPINSPASPLFMNTSKFILGNYCVIIV